MSSAPPGGAQVDSARLAEAEFRKWIRQVVKGATELRAVEAGQIDAVMDSVTGRAILVPAARDALRREIVGIPRRRNARRLAAVARAGTPNCLLAAIPTKEYESLLAGFEVVTLTYGDVLYEPGERMRHVYFPSDSLVSLLAVIDSRRAVEVGLVGREGLVGARLALGIAASSTRALVQGTGTALKISATRFLREFKRAPGLRRAVLLYADALMNQVAQSAACNRFHVIEERLARWLLMTRERLPSSEFRLTHEFLADMLGVRRVGVTAAAGALQRRGLIRYRRGIITILDQPGLEAACCSCYEHVRLLRATA
ncbi:MAG: Crp/Fnr family transcriptional regulator [Steroidobacteraceae bacterium]